MIWILLCFCVFYSYSAVHCFVSIASSAGMQALFAFPCNLRNWRNPSHHNHNLQGVESQSLHDNDNWHFEFYSSHHPRKAWWWHTCPSESASAQHYHQLSSFCSCSWVLSQLSRQRKSFCFSDSSELSMELHFGESSCLKWLELSGLNCRVKIGHHAAYQM